MTSKTSKKKRNKRILTSMLLTLMAAALFGGIAVADRNIRRMGFGDDRPMVGVSSKEGRKSLELCILGQTYSLDVTGAADLFRGARDSIGRLFGTD